jgi:hypothetical protein
MYAHFARYPPIPGDIDHPNSFPYSVVYRQVPGLTFELAQSGGLPDDVRAAFLNAIRDLEKLGVFGITGEYPPPFSPLQMNEVTTNNT